MEESLQNQVVAAIAVTLQKLRESSEFIITEFPQICVEPPKRPEWGDFSSNVAMTLASQLRFPPLKIAGLLATKLRSDFSELFFRVDVASPGFLNFTLHPLRWIDILKTVQEQGPSYGFSHIGKGKRILLEFVSANPTGPLHVGHGRGAALGQAITSLLHAAGFSVSREYYINDAGRQLQLLGRSVYARYCEHWNETFSFPEDGYHGNYIKSLAESVAKAHDRTLLDLPDKEAEEICSHFASQLLLAQIKQDLGEFGVEFETWFSEKTLHTTGLIQESLEELRQKGLLRQENGAWWLCSSAFGDEKDRVVQKQDGSYTYLAADIAYHRQKLGRGYDTLINIWGADHHGYIPRMQATVQAFGHDKETLRIVLVQMVNLLRGGKKMEMSKRAGEFVTLREVLEEVGSDAAKFFFLMRRSDSHLDFDLELAKEQSSDNPVYYVQYAHARLASLFRVAQERKIEVPSIHNVDSHMLLQEDELDLIKMISQYPSIIENSAIALEPHRLTFYLQELAAHLHGYYNRNRVLPPSDAANVPGKEDSWSATTSYANPEKVEEKDALEPITPSLTAARLALLRQVQTVICNGLTLLGLSSPAKM